MVCIGMPCLQNYDRISSQPSHRENTLQPAVPGSKRSIPKITTISFLRADK